jgi:hypothetical protein
MALYMLDTDICAFIMRDGPLRMPRQSLATLVTGYEREFGRVPGLKLENWNEAR